MNVVGRFVVFGNEVVLGKEFFNEGGFKKKGFDLRTDLNVLERSNLGSQGGGFGAEFNGGLKIRADPDFETFGFTDVKNRSGGVFENIDSRLCGQ